MTTCSLARAAGPAAAVAWVSNLPLSSAEAVALAAAAVQPTVPSCPSSPPCPTVHLRSDANPAVELNATRLSPPGWPWLRVSRS
jgi:hypothetical protein